MEHENLFTLHTYDSKEHGLKASFIGPDLTEGARPCVWYFVATSFESLKVDPYNIPALHLAKRGIRVFSINLPLHADDLDSKSAIGRWAQATAENEDIFTPSINQVIHITESLLTHNLISGPIGFMGLSRGNLFATWCASRITTAKAVLGFAPLTNLHYMAEFKDLTSHIIVQKMSLYNALSSLINVPLRYHIGNNDTRVGTHECISFIEKLVQESYLKKCKICPVELLLTPSIGYEGHGTSTPSFIEGATWLEQKIVIKNI